MAKKIKSVNEISGRRLMGENFTIIKNCIEPLCKNYVGFIRFKMFVDDISYKTNIVLEFAKETEIMNELDGSINEIENKLCSIIPYMFSLNFYILYK